MKEKPQLCSPHDEMSSDVPRDSNNIETCFECSSTDRLLDTYQSPHCRRRSDGGSRGLSNGLREQVAASAVHQSHHGGWKDVTNLKREWCRTARTLAIRWLSLLIQKSPDSFKHQAFHTQITDEQEGHVNMKQALDTDVMGNSSHTELSFVEVVKRSTASSPSFNLTGKNNADSSSSIHREDVICSSPPLPVLSTFELVPEEEDSIPQLLSSLREIVLTGTTLGNFSVRKDNVSLNGVPPSVLMSSCRLAGLETEGATGNSDSSSSAVEGQWKDIRAHFSEVCRLVQNRDELTSVLDTALGLGWSLDAEPAKIVSAPSSNWEVTLEPSEEEFFCATPLLCALPSAKKTSSEELHQVTSGSTVSSTLNHNAPPFESRLRLVTPGTAPAVEPPLRLPAASQYFPSSPLLAQESDGMAETETAGARQVSATGGKATTPPSASSQMSSPATTFRLESREDMLRRRTAASAAVSQYPYASNGSYYNGRSRVSWSGSVSPVLSFMNPMSRHSQCPFDYLLVLDFEATCEENTPASYLHEIIEFPVVVVDVKLQRAVAEFHRFVKPKMQPQLSEFCRYLTGIQQEDIDSAVLLEDVIRQFERWYAQTIPPGSRTMLATDGPTDLREFMYMHSVGRQGIRFPSMFYQWIDVKRAFAHFFQCQQGKIRAMLDVLHCPFEGRLHSGIDDARNIARIVIRMLQLGCSFCEIPLSRLPYGSPGLSTGLLSPSVAPSGSTDGDASLQTK